ncbi:hypothetical protein Dimus_026990 [Dionaea muscipula]
MHKLDSMMMKIVRRATLNADCIIVVVDACKIPEKWYEKFTNVDDVIAVSAKYGQAVDDIKEWILSKLPIGPAYYPKDILSEHPERFFVAEIVREKILLQYRNEITYACQPDAAARHMELLARWRDYVPLLTAFSCPACRCTSHGAAPLRRRSPELAAHLAHCSPLQAARRILMQGGNMLAQATAGRQAVAARMAPLLANSHG